MSGLTLHGTQRDRANLLGADNDAVVRELDVAYFGALFGCEIVELGLHGAEVGEFGIEGFGAEGYDGGF